VPVLLSEGLGCKGMDWIHLVQDRDKWQAVVNTTANLLVPYHAGNFLSGFITVSYCH
jgi:hypothetical protein